MKTAKEFFDRLSADREFRDDVFNGLDTKKEAGAADPATALTELAAELDYEVGADLAAAFFGRPDAGFATIDDSDLEAVVGGYIFMARDSGLDNDLIVDDKTGDILWEGHLESYLDGRKKAYALGVSDLCIDWAYYDLLREPFRHPSN